MSTILYVSRAGLATCPSCQNHMKVGEDAATTVCPFCDTTLHHASKTPGHGAISRLRKSRSGMMLAALGVSISLAACEQKSADVVDDATPVAEQPEPSASTPPPESQPAPSAADMGSADMASDKAQDMTQDMLIKPAKESVAVPKYGLPPKY